MSTTTTTDKINDKIFIKSLKYYNFSFLQNEEDYDSYNFYYFCKYDYIDIVKYLLQHYKYDSERTKIKKDNCCYELTALYIAVKKENIEIVKLLLSDHNYKINVKSKYQENEKDKFFGIFGHYYSNEYKKSAFHAAIENENIDIIILFLACQRYDINVLYKYHNYAINVKVTKTALQIAVEGKNSDVVALLLSCERLDINTNYEVQKENSNTIGTALFIAIKNEDLLNVINLLSCERFDVNSYLIKTINKKPFGCIDKSIEHKSALNFAIEKMNHEIINMLSSCHRLNVNQKSVLYTEYHFEGTDTTLTRTTETHYGQTVDVECRETTAHINDKKTRVEKTPIQYAIDNDNYDILSILLKNINMDLNTYNTYYNYELKIRYKYTTIVEILFKTK